MIRAHIWIALFILTIGWRVVSVSMGWSGVEEVGYDIPYLFGAAVALSIHWATEKPA